MDQGKNSNGLQWMIGGALVLIGLFVIVALVSINSQATGNNVATSASVPNLDPEVTSFAINNSATYNGTNWYNEGGVSRPCSGCK